MLQNLNQNPIQDVFDLIVWHSGNPSSKISHALIERFAKRGFYVDGRHLCVIQVDPHSGVCDSLIACAQHTPADSWSGAHDEGCECYESSTTLLQHWCLPNYLGPHNHISELLRLLVLAGEDVNGQCDPQGYPMETIFGIKMSFMTDPCAGEVLAWKFLDLIEHGARPPLSRRMGDALSRAIVLRRKCRVYNHTVGLLRKKIHSHVFEYLDGMIDVLKDFKKIGTWPVAKLDRLKEKAERFSG